MTESNQQIRCSDCGAVLSDQDRRPCPECGGTARTVRVNIVESVEVADSLSWEKRREYYQKHPVTLATVVVITVGAPFLGLAFIGWTGVLIGLALGIACFWLSPFAITKVKEIERG